MRVLTAAAALAVGERASGRPPGEQALALVAGCSGLAPEVVAELTVGDRDRRLLAAYQGLFGRRGSVVPAVRPAGNCSNSNGLAGVGLRPGRHCPYDP